MIDLQGILIIVPVFLTYWFYFFDKLLPYYDTQHYFTNINSTIYIYRDTYAVPHIQAETVYDAYFGLGWVHAQDRLWQMHMLRKAAKGELSEAFGEDLLPLDKLIRTLGFKKRAEQQKIQINGQALEMISGYVDGINSYINDTQLLPVEFQIFFLSFEEYTIEDSLTFSNFMDFMLGLSWGNKLIRHYLRQHLPENIYADLFNFQVNEVTIIKDNEFKVSKAKESTEQLFGGKLKMKNFKYNPRIFGSNNWVISGDYTESGFPIMAFDPHLTNQMPSMWYLYDMEIQGKFKLHLQGGGVPCLPQVLFGHNGKVAFSGTVSVIDNIDIFEEIVNPSNTSFYLFENKWTKLKIEKEIFKMVGGSTKEFEIKYTKNGPIITPELQENLPRFSSLFPFFESNSTYSLKWLPQIKEFNPINLNWELLKSRNVKDYIRKSKNVMSPGLNVLLADVKKNIGYTPLGQYLDRRNTSFYQHEVRQGWIKNQDKDWTLLNQTDEPFLFNPERGFIVTANNKITNLLNMHYESGPYTRAQRIEQYIQNELLPSKNITMDQMIEMQIDTSNQEAIVCLNSMLEQLHSHRWYRSLMRKWNKKMEKESYQATIFAVWHSFLFDEIINQFDSDFVDIIKREFSITKLPLQLFQKNFDSNDILHLRFLKSQENTSQLLSRSLTNAIQKLIDHFGTEDSTKWTYGEIHTVNYGHLPFEQVPILNDIFGKVIQISGSHSSISSYGYDWTDKELNYKSEIGPNLRGVMDLSNLNNSLFCIDTGQSGNLFSQHYFDQNEKFSTGNYIKLSFDEEKVVHTQKLVKTKKWQLQSSALYSFGL